MQIGMRHFSAETVTQVMEELSKPSTTRGDLARLLCELDEQHNRKGRPAISSARKALAGLADKAGFSLPTARAGVAGRVSEFSPPAGLQAPVNEKDKSPVRMLAVSV